MIAFRIWDGCVAARQKGSHLPQTRGLAARKSPIPLSHLKRGIALTVMRLQAPAVFLSPILLPSSWT
jgi:hypothetical protein